MITKGLQTKKNGELAKDLQIDEDSKLARHMERISRNHETAMEIYRRS
jgi:Skp family chaperone for outer membrane proteins